MDSIDQDSVTYSAYLDMQGITTLKGEWVEGQPPHWTVCKSLSGQYQRHMHEIVGMAWREIGGGFTPNELGTMITCLEVVSTKLGMRMVVPEATQDKLLSLSAFVSRSAT